MDTIAGVHLHRCRWAQADPLLRQYHDAKWGRPERDSRALWEKLMLDGFQAGLSWKTVLKKRDAFRLAFRGIDPFIVAAFGADDVADLSKMPITANFGNRLALAKPITVLLISDNLDSR